MTRGACETERLVDQLADLYLSWREETCALDLAYTRWARADREERGAAFAAYRAQLDLEEHAASCYQRGARMLAGHQIFLLPPA